MDLANVPLPIGTRLIVSGSTSSHRRTVINELVRASAPAYELLFRVDLDSEREKRAAAPEMLNSAVQAVPTGLPGDDTHRPRLLIVEDFRLSDLERADNGKARRDFDKANRLTNYSLVLGVAMGRPGPDGFERVELTTGSSTVIAGQCPG